jgi:hypothetical protein
LKSGKKRVYTCESVGRILTVIAFACLIVVADDADSLDNIGQLNPTKVAAEPTQAKATAGI